MTRQSRHAARLPRSDRFVTFPTRAPLQAQQPEAVTKQQIQQKRHSTIGESLGRSLRQPESVERERVETITEPVPVVPRVEDDPAKEGLAEGVAKFAKAAIIAGAHP